MPLPLNTVTPTQFDALQENISLQVTQLGVAVDLAFSGLQQVVLFQATTPEVDLINPFATHFTKIENTDNDALFIQVTSALNNHVVIRGTTPQGGEGLSDRLNRWLWCNGVKVTRTYATISSGAGWLIDECNIETPNTCGPTSLFFGTPYAGCPPTPGDPVPPQP